MTKTDATRLRVVVLLVPVALGFACVKRDWNFCSPQDPCQTGFVCTSNWQCVRATDGGATDGGPDGAAGQDSGSGAQDQRGGDASASPERGSDVPGSTVVETNVDAMGSTVAETSVDATGSTTAIETGAEAALASDAASPDILHAPDASSAATDLSPILDARSSGSDVPGAPLDAAMAPDTAPPGSPLGFVCLKPSDCASGYCSDGVCCNSVCLGACQSCTIVGQAGTCSDVTGSPAPGHPACGGIGTCAGSCSGQSASCSFPDAKTICGPASCTNGTAYSAPTCDGAGTCSPSKSTPCGTFACGTTACLSSCSDSSQCVVGAACVDSKCVQCAAGEAACPNLCANLQTDNAHCGSCSGTGSVCSATQQCTGGKCLLADGQSCTNNSLCASGVCNTFYVDADGDGYPVSSPYSGYCHVSSSPVPGYIPARPDAKWDCCDSDSKVHPDQPAYFTSPSASCGWDYDCSGTVEKMSEPDVGDTCAIDATGTACVLTIADGIPSSDCGQMYGYPAMCDLRGAYCTWNNFAPNVGLVACH